MIYFRDILYIYNTMKLSPVMIFILLLLLLVISVVFCRWAMYNMDGFVGYNFDVEPLTSVKITNYSDKNNLYKLYDSLYFDNQNGNIVQPFWANTSGRKPDNGQLCPLSGVQLLGFLTKIWNVAVLANDLKKVLTNCFISN